MSTSQYIGHFDGGTLNDVRGGAPVYAADWLHEEAVLHEGVYYVDATASGSRRDELLGRARVLAGS